MADLIYKDEGYFQDGSHKISLYDGNAWLMTYRGYINKYCHIEMKLYPYVKGTGVSSQKAPGKHGVSIFDIRKEHNYGQKRK